MKFKCEFTVDNAEFQGDYFSAAIYYTLKRIAGKFDMGTLAHMKPGPIHSQSVMDVNGNRIGTFKIVEDNDG